MKKIALVTGGGSGIGRAIALGLALLGSEVFLGGRDERRLQVVADEIARQGGRAWPCAGDLADDAQLRKLAQRVLDEGGGIDVLVNCAGSFKMGSWESEPVEDLDELYRITLRAPYQLTQLLLPALKARTGQVVFINSSAALMAGAKWGAYSAMKAGLKSLADSLRAEVNSSGVRVVSVFPGRTATPMQERIFGLENRPYSRENLIQPEDVARMVVAALELPHTAEVTDIFVRPTKKLA
ncbi:MAG TPA: short-chain dehydrogenase [Verrucomicrobia bacterium]|nr:short-chain dehydrogenase [Verrucomicrobiota bacterium]